MLEHASIQLTGSRARFLRTEPWLALMTAASSTIAAWREISRSRRVLATLDDHQLRDIGVSRDEARIEGEKPFWKP
jgi:uncharacterized protein YjiS (DUF1127 family)